MRRYIELKKGGVNIFGTGKDALVFPNDHPINFRLSNRFYTPIPDLIKYVTDVLADSPLSFITIIPSIVDSAEQIFGVSAKPRGYYASAWEKSDPLSFIITIDLKFGWLGLYNGEIEIKNIAEKIIDASLPYMNNLTVNGASSPTSKDKVNLIMAPGPNGIDVVLNAVGMMMDQVKENLGFLSSLIPDSKNKNNLLKDAAAKDGQAYARLRYDLPSKTWYAVGGDIFRTKDDKKISGSDHEGSRADFVTRLGKTGEAQVKALESSVTKTFLSGGFVQCFYLDENQNKNDFLEVGSQDITKFTARTSTGSKTFSNMMDRDTILVPINNKIGVTGEVVETKGTDMAKLGKNNIWTVVINGTMTLKDLVLSDLSYSFSNEQDNRGYPISATLQLNFHSQNVPVASSDLKETNYMDIVAEERIKKEGK